MLIKFKTKSARVKAISFHPTRPWVLVSLHTGTIQLWDYRIKSMIEKYEDHRGPVRGLCFHKNKPIFVSGGDDYKIKEHPWIISASDDQTCRIWNWQSRQCLGILAGHSNYVMCAIFHPVRNLVASCSLDQTIRIWDISNLFKKNISPPQSAFEEKIRAVGRPELFSIGDFIVMHVLEGHDGAVNWVEFHKKLPILLSASDDKLIRIWKITDTKATQFDTLRGHHNHVSHVIFHPFKDIVISNSVDQTIRFWDLNSRICIDSHRIENDRFWCLGVHPSNNLIAAGHDSGLMVFKLESERPAFCVCKESMFYFSKNTVRRLDFKTNRDEKVYSRTTTKNRIKALEYNFTANCLILKMISKSKDITYTMINFSNTGGMEKNHAITDAVWITRNRYVLLDRSNNLLVKNMEGEITKKIAISNVEKLFYYGLGCVLLKEMEMLTLFDIQQNKKLISCKFPKVKYIHWREDGKFAALLCVKSIYIVDRQLNSITSIRENTRVKSGLWDSNVFVYTTNHHIKYLLMNGDFGIIRTLEFPVYLAAIYEGKLYCIDRSVNIRIVQIDTTEYKFKLALITKRYDEVLNMIRTTKLIGQSIIAYLQKKGYPEIALHFVNDDKTKFSLALECGNLEVALASARKIDLEKCWTQLSQVALKHGNLKIVELCYQRINDLDQLAFFYIISGQTAKLLKIMKTTESKNDHNLQLQIAMFSGMYTDQVRILEKCGNPSIAYLLANNYSIEEPSQKLREILPESVTLNIDKCKKHFNLPQTPKPINESAENWPKLNIERNLFDIVTAQTSVVETNGIADNVAEASWETDSNDSDNDGFATPRSNSSFQNDESSKNGDEDEGWEEEDIEINNYDIKNQNTPQFIMPQTGIAQTRDVLTSKNVSDHIAIGSILTAIELLRKQYAIQNVSVYDEIFNDIFTKSSLNFKPSINSKVIPVYSYRNRCDSNLKIFLPIPFYTKEDLQEKLKSALNFKKFYEAIDNFRSILRLIPLIPLNTKVDYRYLKEIAFKCREYILGLSIELERRNLSKNDQDKEKCLQLAALSTHCQFDTPHMLLSLKVAMNNSYKCENFKSAAEFAQRYLSMGPNTESAEKANKILNISQKNNSEAILYDYDSLNPFKICSKLFVPLYSGSDQVECKFCGASYAMQFANSICNIDGFSDFDYHIPLDGTYHFGWTTKNLGISHDYVESGKVLIRQMSDETETPSIGDVNDFLNYSYPALWSISVELTSQLPKIIGPTGPMGPPGPSNSGPIGVPCLLNVLNCEQKCMESDDNMWCECNNGFLLNNDGITCQDENECLSEGQGRCSHICVNTSGSYHCICRAGYSLTKDGRTCEGFIFLNLIIVSNSTQLIDLDECQDPIIVENCPFCLNTVGSYTCARLRFSDTNP
ncbi:Alpha-COP [Intoshia linei]|uniref:Alpha-COP n=1 Tax=Intoshia linei TaxID=1819745 RepID=A0A177B1W6_9BILA|nr:Alpha-COP [Intoshia linei]